MCASTIFVPAREGTTVSCGYTLRTSFQGSSRASACVPSRLSRAALGSLTPAREALQGLRRPSQGSTPEYTDNAPIQCDEMTGKIAHVNRRAAVKLPQLRVRKVATLQHSLTRVSMSSNFQLAIKLHFTPKYALMKDGKHSSGSQHRTAAHGRHLEGGVG